MDSSLKTRHSLELVFMRLHRMNQPQLEGAFREKLKSPAVKATFDAWLATAPNDPTLGEVRLGAPGTLGVSQAARFFGASRDVYGTGGEQPETTVLRTQAAAVSVILSGVREEVAKAGGASLPALRSMLAEMPALMNAMRDSIASFERNEKSPHQFLPILAAVEELLDRAMNGPVDDDDLLLVAGRLNQTIAELDAGTMSTQLDVGKMAGAPVSEPVKSAYQKVQGLVGQLRSLIPGNQFPVQVPPERSAFQRVVTEAYASQLEAAVAELKGALGTDASRPWSPVLAGIEQLRHYGLAHLNREDPESALGVINHWHRASEPLKRAIEP